MGLKYVESIVSKVVADHDDLLKEKTQRKVLSSFLTFRVSFQCLKISESNSFKDVSIVLGDHRDLPQPWTP